MSLKPPKKGDLNKSWMKSRRDNRRPIRPEYHLIITEGAKTEPLYFETIKDIVNRAYPERIQLSVCGTGKNTLGLFQMAQAEAARSNNIYRHVWVVYDTDDFPPENINRTAMLCEKESNEETTYHAIWSNQCIELWYLLHFSFIHSDISRSSYMRKLTEILIPLGFGEYGKNRPDMYQILFPYMDAAVANAKKLDAQNSNNSPAASAPGTRVYLLVEKLQPYLNP